MVFFCFKYNIQKKEDEDDLLIVKRTLVLLQVFPLNDHHGNVYVCVVMNPPSPHTHTQILFSYHSIKFIFTNVHVYKWWNLNGGIYLCVFYRTSSSRSRTERENNLDMIFKKEANFNQIASFFKR